MMELFIEKKISTGKYLAKITITNSSNDFYALPIDKSGFKAYYSSEYCGNQNDIEYPYKYFSPTIMLVDNSTKKLLEASSKRLDIEENYIAQYVKNAEIKAKKNKKLILKWKNKNNIKNYIDANKSFYLMNSLMTLKPKEKVSYNTELNLTEILRSDSSAIYDYYYLDFHAYTLSLDLCIDEVVYLNLKQNQKKKLKKYKLFNGIIKSNNFSFEAYK